MITITDVAEGILNGYSFEMKYRLDVYLGGELVAADIPAVEVSEETDATQRVPERLTFKVPLESDGLSWVPTSYTDPIGIWGQRVVAQIGVGTSNGQFEWIDRGTFLIVSANTSGSSISVECGGLFYLLDEAELATEYQPKASATLGTILRAMVEPGITVDLTGAPSDRTAPTGISWSDNRLDNVYAVLDAWPAQASISEAGVMVVTSVPSDPSSSEFDFTDGVGGTVVEYAVDLSRDGAFNAVVAKGVYPDTHATKAGQEIISTAYDTDLTSPFRVGGDFSPYIVPYGYASPLMSTLAMVQSAATTRLRTLRNSASRTVQITAVPHPALTIGTDVSVTSARLGLSSVLGRIESMSLSYDGAAMAARVRLVD